MKGYHFTIIFTFIAITVLTIIDIETEELSAVIDAGFIIEAAYMTAVDAGTKNLIISVEQNDVLEKEKAAEQFFYTLTSALGLLDDPYQQEMISLYIPVIAIITNDGFYILYNEEYDNSNGKKGIKKQWTELIPYSYEDDNFVYRFTLGDTVSLYDKNKLLRSETLLVTLDYHEINNNTEYNLVSETDPDNIMLDDVKFKTVKSMKIISKIEEYLTYYTNLNNYIAKHYGVTYNFNMPSVDNSEWIRSINSISMITLFQGYPYNNGREYYNQFVVSGASIKKTHIFYIVPEDYYFVYHRADCDNFIRESEIKTCYSIEECAKEGAFGCENCMY